MAYAYLIGTFGLGIIFSFLCWARRDLRKIIIYSGVLYLLYGFLMFLVIKLLVSDPTRTITPGYWGPPSLLNLNGRSGGYGIEDALFSLFAGGIAAGLYNLVFDLGISKKSNNHLKRGHALAVALLIGISVLVLTPLNAIYFFIFLQFSGAMSVIVQRKDLIKHSLAGGIIFMFLYGLLFQIFILLFPHFLNNYYHLQRTTHISINGMPLEEVLYGLTLGMMWAPIYEYEFRLKDKKVKSLVLRKLVPAVGATRR